VLAARIPSSIDAPLPSSVLVMIDAPAAEAASGVPSIEPSSTTMTSPTFGWRRAKRTTSPIVSDCFGVPALRNPFQVDALARQTCAPRLPSHHGIPSPDLPQTRRKTYGKLYDSYCLTGPLKKSNVGVAVVLPPQESRQTQGWQCNCRPNHLLWMTFSTGC
jgi:hypothetical protein